MSVRATLRSHSIPVTVVWGYAVLVRCRVRHGSYQCLAGLANNRNQRDVNKISKLRGVQLL
jgi:hypothetical protein